MEKEEKIDFKEENRKEYKRGREELKSREQEERKDVRRRE